MDIHGFVSCGVQCARCHHTVLSWVGDWGKDSRNWHSQLFVTTRLKQLYCCPRITSLIATVPTTWLCNMPVLHMPHVLSGVVGSCKYSFSVSFEADVCIFRCVYSWYYIVGVYASVYTACVGAAWGVLCMLPLVVWIWYLFQRFTPQQPWAQCSLSWSPTRAVCQPFKFWLHCFGNHVMFFSIYIFRMA